MPPRTPVRKRTQTPTGPLQRLPIGLRVPRDQLEEIQRRALAANLSMSEYMIRASLGEPIDARSLERRVEDLEREMDRRLSRLEELSGF